MTTRRRWVVVAVMALPVLSVVVAATAWAQSTRSDPCGFGDPCDQDDSSSASDLCDQGIVDPITGAEDPCDND